MIMKSLVQHKSFWDYVSVIVLTCIVAVFFYPTILQAKLPVPSDTLVGLYHPYRDKYTDEYPNGIPFKNFLITDPVRQQIPWRKAVIDSVSQFKLPKWDGWTFSGSPLLSNIQSGAFYPLNLLFFIFPFATAWTLLIISQPLLSGIFLYIFLRHKRLDYLPSLFGAVCFVFSGFSIAWLTWGTLLSTWLWTPLSLVAVDKVRQVSGRAKLFWAAILICSVVFSFFAGHTQVFLYSLLVIALYVVSDSKKRQALIHDPTFAIIAGIMVLLTMPVWKNMLEWLPQTSRLMDSSAWKSEGFFIPVKHLIQFFSPDYFGNPATLNYWGTWNYGEMVGYIGIGGLTAAIIGIGSQTMFWLSLLVVALIFAVASPIAALPYQLHIPFISTLQPTRLLVIVDFCLSILGAYGLAYTTDKTKGKRTITTLFSLTFIFAGLWISVFVPQLLGISRENMAVAKRNLVIPTLLFTGISLLLIAPSLFSKMKRVKYNIIPLVIILVVIMDLFRFGWKYTPFTPETYFFPTTKIISYLTGQPKPFRIMTTDDRILPPNVNAYYGIESVGGYDPIHSLRYEEFIAAMERDKPDITPPFGFNRIISPKNILSPLSRLLNVRYVLSFDDITGAGYHQVMKEGKTILFEKSDRVPRAYLVENVHYERQKQNIINALYAPSFNPTADAVVEYPVSVLNVPLTMAESVNLRSYKANEILLEAKTTQPRLLVVNNIDNAGWHAFVDKKSVPIYRTNYLFIGIVVPGGSHSVRLMYE